MPYENDNIIYKDIAAILNRYRQMYNSTAKLIISNINIKCEDCSTIVPKRGNKKKLLDLAKINMEQLKHEVRINKTMVIDKTSILQQLQNLLQLKKTPRHIECFDNSNLCGTNPVSSCVVFKDGEPSINDYRHFKIRTVIGADDYKTMKEVIERRYKHAVMIPDLIIIDGGIGQLHAAINILDRLKIINEVDVCGLAKQFEEIIFDDGRVVCLPGNSQELRLIQHIRDEAHRFAITFHRQLRNKKLLM